MSDPTWPPRNSRAKIAGATARLEQQLQEAQQRERQIADTIAEQRNHATEALLRALREGGPGDWQQLAASDSAADLVADLDEALAAARTAAYHCRHALAELKRATSRMEQFGSLSE